MNGERVEGACAAWERLGPCGLTLRGASPRDPVRPLLGIRRILAVALLLGGAVPSHAEPPEEKPAEPKLVLDAQGFTSRVNSLAFSPDRQLLAAAGNDKTVRIFHLETGQIQATLRGYDGIGAEGECAAVAFSPSGRELLVGVQSNTTEGAIRVYDVADFEQIAQLLPGHDRGGVVRLAFSRDGRFLASVGADDEVLIWDWPTRKVRGRATVQGLPSYLGFLTDIPVLIAFDRGGVKAWSALHAKEFAKLLPAEKGELGAPALVQKTLGRLMAMDRGMRQVKLPYAGLEDARYLDLDVGHDLRSGSGTKAGRPCYFVGLWSDVDGRLVRLYEGHGYGVPSLALSSDGAWVASGDHFGEIHLWEVATGKRKSLFSGSGRRIYSVGWAPNGQGLAFGTKPHTGTRWKFNDYADLEQTFDLDKRRIRDEITGNPQTAILREGDRELAPEIAAEWNVNALSYRRQGRRVSRYTFPPGVMAMCATFAKSSQLGLDEAVIVGRDDNAMMCMDLRGMIGRREFVGHSAPVTAAAVSPDGRFLASSSIDRTLRVWSLANLKIYADPDFDYSAGGIVTYVLPGGFAERAGIRYGDLLSRMGGLDMPTLVDRYINDRWPFKVGEAVDFDMSRGGKPYRAKVTLIASSDFIEPLISLFIDHAGEWVAWTPQGYYDASPGGDRLIGWHVNDGRARAAKFYLARQFRKRFYRPDIIDRVLELGDVSKAVAAANAARPRPVEMLDLRKVDDLKKIEPPIVRLIEPDTGARVRGGRVTVRAEVRSQNGLPITEVKILVDGRPAQGGEVANGPDDTPERRTVTQEVDVPHGRSEVSVLAMNKESTSQPVAVVVERSGGAEPPKPKVYVFAVGISQYVLKDLNLRFAHKDATDFAAAWEPQKDVFYSGVDAHSLIDVQASASQIRDGLQRLAQAAKPEDVAILFMSSHGMRDASGDYYLGTHEIDPDRLLATGIPSTEFIRQVAKLPCKVLIFVDTCHSGGLGAKLVDDPLRELVSDEVGAILFASSTPREESLEYPKLQNGAFSKAILDTLQDPASDLDRDGKLTITELDFWIDNRVQKFTRGQQHPTTHKPSTIPNFAIYQFLKPSSGSAPGGRQ